MNLAVIPHPSDLMALIKKQKDLLSAINSKSGQGILFPLYPLYLTIEKCDGKNEGEIKERIEEIKRNISSIIIEDAAIDSEGLAFPFTYTLNGKDCSGNIKAGIWEKNSQTIKNQIPSDDKKIFRLVCRIFQIAVIKQEKNSYMTMDAVWVKLKKEKN